jgi:hypothetical protein
MPAFDLIQQQAPGQGVEDVRRWPADAPLLEADDVVRAHVCKPCELLAPQPGHAPPRAAIQPEELRRNPRPAASHELAQLAGGRHRNEYDVRPEPGTRRTRNALHWMPRRPAGSMESMPDQDPWLPDDPAQLLVADPARREPVSFQSDGLRLAAHLYRPADAGRTPGIVMAGPVSSVKEQTLPHYGERFASAGYTVLTFDRADSARARASRASTTTPGGSSPTTSTGPPT